MTKKRKIKRLHRSKQDKMVAGVCAGIANYYNKDPILIRLVYVLLMVVTGVIPLLIAYIILWIIVSKQ